MFQFKIANKEIFSFGRSIESTLTGKKILEIIGGEETSAGVTVSESTALNLSAVFCAIRVIAESIAYLPLQVFQKTDKGKELFIDHPLYFKLHDQPNNFQTAFTFRETMATQQCLNGNSYAKIERDAIGNITQLIPLGNQTQTTNLFQTSVGFNIIIPYFDTKRSLIFYLVNGKEIIEQVNMLHIPALSIDGIVGKSPIQVARESIGLGLVQEKFAARFFGKGANPDFILEHPGALSKQAIQNIKDNWDIDAAGIKNSHKPRVLEEGMKVTKLSIAPEEAQFLQSRQFQIAEIARWFRLPPHMIGDLSGSTFSNIENQDIGFVKYSLAPWLKRWEQELNRKLLREDEKRDTFIEFNLDALLRGDTTTRGEYYTKMIAARVFSPNEIRAMENRNAYEGGDKFENPNTTSPLAVKQNGQTQLH